MSAPLVRRAGTVSALVAAAGVTMVAGVWPVAGVATAQDQRPAQQEPVVEEPVAEQPVAEEPAMGPVVPPGQEKKAPVAGEPVVEQPVAQEPVAQEPVVEEPVAAAPAPRTKSKGPGRLQDAVDRGAPTEPVAQEPVAQEPVAEETVVGPPAKGPVKNDKKDATPAPGAQPAPAAGPKKEPVMGPVAAPPKKEPVVGPVAAPPKKEPVVGPVAEPAPVVAAPVPGSGRGISPAARGPRAVLPAARPAAPAARPVLVGPKAPAPAQPVAAPMGPRVPARTVAPRAVSSLASAGSLSGRPHVAAADALPLRPAGGEQVVLPRVSAARPAPRPIPVDLTTAIPSLAAGTAQAVARTPELPLGIAGVVIIFLLLQNRIDRRDPKLAHSNVEEDEPLVFEAAGPVHLRLVTAA